jgi:hypothetical protein
VRHLTRKNVLTHGNWERAVTPPKELEQIMRAKPKSRSAVTLLQLMPMVCRDKAINFPINPNPHSVGSTVQPGSSPFHPRGAPLSPFSSPLLPSTTTVTPHFPGFRPFSFLQSYKNFVRPPDLLPTESNSNSSLLSLSFVSPFVYSRSFHSFYLP